MLREELLRLRHRVLGRRGVGPVLLAPAARVVEAVRCSLVEGDGDVGAQAAATLHQRGAAGGGCLLVGGAMENLNRSVGAIAVLVEPSLQSAPWIENERGPESGLRRQMLEAGGVDGHGHEPGAAAVRPAEEPDSLGRDVWTRAQIGER